MAPDQEDGFDSDAVRTLSTLSAPLSCLPKTWCLGDLQGTGEMSCYRTSVLGTDFEAHCCVQEERLEREAEGKRMLLEGQHAAGGYSSHRNYQNLSARSPDTIEEVRHAAEPTLPENGTFIWQHLLFCVAEA